eukprot:scaffold12646_cov146-Skeletonema_dohrnii-CCMP3373.AAC.1
MASTYETKADMFCASCGKSEVDNIKMMDCDACDLVRYCSDECQQEHRPQHGEICKERAAELRDEKLFRQPESSHRGDCPICFLPLSLDIHRAISQSCCSKWICDGCFVANQKRELEEKKLQAACPFCRHPLPTTMEEVNKNKMKRVEKNDPVALRHVAKKHCKEKDYERAIEYWTKAADLGDVEAHFDLAFMYWKGKGVEKDEKRGLYHLVEAAIAGHPDARYNLALKEGRSERFDRAVKHFIIAANLGHGGSIQMLKEFYAEGLVSKEDFAAALRAHQAAVDATKSPQRDAASEFYAAQKERREGGSQG